MPVSSLTRALSPSLFLSVGDRYRCSLTPAAVDNRVAAPGGYAGYVGSRRRCRHVPAALARRRPSALVFAAVGDNNRWWRRPSTTSRAQASGPGAITVDARLRNGYADGQLAFGGRLTSMLYAGQSRNRGDTGGDVRRYSDRVVRVESTRPDIAKGSRVEGSGSSSVGV